MGGAIFSMQGELTIIDSTLTGNRAIPGADAVPVHAAAFGGAVFSVNGSFTATASTFATNTAANDGASIYNLVYDAAAARTAQTTVTDSIVARGTGPTDLASAKPAAVTGAANNPGSSASANVAQFDLVQTRAARGGGTLSGSPLTGDPMLLPLSNNGGPTATMAPADGSPVIDAGRAAGLSSDQRGHPRRADFSGVSNATGGDGSDIGAVEVDRVCATEADPGQPCHLLTVTLAGRGTGGVTGLGISCPETCSGSYGASAIVTLIATPKSGSGFSGWSGACTGSGACKLKLSANRAVVATFKPLPPATTITTAKISGKHHSAKFTFEAAGRTTGFQCKLVRQRKGRGAPKPRFSSCKSPKTFRHLKPGKYAFSVRALSPTGTGPSAKRRFTI